MKSIYSLTLLLLFLPTANADNRSHQLAAEQVLQATYAEQVVPQALQQLKASYSHMVKDLPLHPSQAPLETRYRQRAFLLAQQQLSWQQLKPQFIQLYTDTYTESELKDIAQFYRTETGKKYLKNMPSTLRQTSVIVHKYMQTIQQEFTTIVNELAEQADLKTPPSHAH
ncbi:hypothetical protein BEL05_00560 [Shewanella colwelliana]|uniref:DUF2059 domain-containing protein n=1 Tax=Shewanella colwelliana TaxID=23 RepID=A0A1E5IU90_SHECO|nr:DUF2059 domain-containing protein [Shewanella colwelliana]OEG74124.1 hypothetical protein BEL05_00560 [Shewanella colwelliana]